MRFTERKEFVYDSEMASRHDTVVAMRLYDEYTRRYSCQPGPTFFEVDTAATEVDPLWHMPVADRTRFSRELKISTIHTAEKADWRLTKAGLAPQQKHIFTLSNLSLQAADFFPRRGDLVFWDGYRLQITDATIDPGAYWLQTNVWLGMAVRCMIVPDGDSRPVLDLSKTVPSERGPNYSGL